MDNGLSIKLIAVLLGLFLIWMLVSVQSTKAGSVCSAGVETINKTTSKSYSKFNLKIPG